MKKTDLQSMIREEVRSQVKQYLSVVLPLVVNEVVDYRSSQLRESILESQPTPKASKKSVVKESVEEYPTLGGRTFNSTDIRELLGLTEVAKLGATGRHAESQQTAVPAILERNTEHGSVPVSADEVPEFVKKALTRDYSSLVKKMAEKK